MADNPRPTAAPQPLTSPPNHPYTPRSTSVADGSETEFEPTPPHSPGGPQYEDLPPSYDFALSDARNGVASLDANQIEAHRVSANEGPDEPEVWEYRMRGGVAEDEETYEHEEAPAYDGHVPVQHVASSENIPVGRVGDFHTASSNGGNRTAPVSEDPPHSIPISGSTSFAQGFGRRGGHRSQPWTPFGAPSYGPFGTPGHGPFGAPGNTPFGHSGNGPFGRGHAFGQRGCGGRPGRGRRGRGARPDSSQDWAAFSQNIGRWGEDFGRRMGDWGEQLGRQAGAMGEQIGRQAGAMGQQLGRDAEAWATAYNTNITNNQTSGAAESSAAGISEPPRYDEPPSYQGTEQVAKQETGISHSNCEVDTFILEKMPQPPSAGPSDKAQGKQKADSDDHDDDDSSISSESTGTSSSSSDSEDDEYDETQAVFLKRIESINKAAEAAVSKGKRNREDIEHERELAIAQAMQHKEDAELKCARKQSRRTQQRELRSRRRELAREYKQKKRDLREKVSSKGKGKGNAKKGAEWKDLKKEYRAKRRILKRERMDAKREWKRETREERRSQKAGSAGDKAEQKVLNNKF